MSLQHYILDSDLVQPGFNRCILLVAATNQPEVRRPMHAVRETTDAAFTSVLAWPQASNGLPVAQRRLLLSGPAPL